MPRPPPVTAPRLLFRRATATTGATRLGCSRTLASCGSRPRTAGAASTSGSSPASRRPTRSVHASLHSLLHSSLHSLLHSSLHSLLHSSLYSLLHSLHRPGRPAAPHKRRTGGAAALTRRAKP